MMVIRVDRSPVSVSWGKDSGSLRVSAVASLKALQEVENSKILAEAQAKAVIVTAEKGIVLPNVLPESMFYNLGLDKYVPSARK